MKPRTVRPSPLKKKEKTQHSQNYIHIHINIYRMVAIYPPHLPTRRYHPPHRQHARPDHRLCPSRARNGDGPVFDRIHAGGYLWICVGRKFYEDRDTECRSEWGLVRDGTSPYSRLGAKKIKRLIVGELIECVRVGGFGFTLEIRRKAEIESVPTLPRIRYWFRHGLYVCLISLFPTPATNPKITSPSHSPNAVDGLAHLGGWAMGILCGTILYPAITETKRRKYVIWGCRVVALALIIMAMVMTIKNFCMSPLFPTPQLRLFLLRETEGC